jgi:hypothetical protein
MRRKTGIGWIEMPQRNSLLDHITPRSKGGYGWRGPLPLSPCSPSVVMD